MSSATFPLLNLPFEVLLHVVELLDCGDISSFCQVSRDLDTIATPVLYRTLKWDDGAGFMQPGRVEEECIYRPCLAFRRRPLLRNYVRAVILYSSRWRIDWLEPERIANVRLICKELSLLHSLYKLEWHDWQASHSHVYHEKLDLVIDAVANLRSVREIYIPLVFPSRPPVLTLLGQKFSAISIHLGKHPDIVIEWLEKQRGHLQELHIVAWKGASFDLSANFHALRRFSQDPVTNIQGFLAAIKEMNQLKELSIGITAEGIYYWDATVQPANLSKLQSLKINILGSYKPPYETFAQAIFYCYASIGAHPRDLQIVHICAASPQLIQGEMEGDKLFSKIIHDHAESIRALRLDDMTATKETLVRLLSRCTRLEELGLKVLKNLGVPLSTFGTVAPLSGTLQSLNVVVVHSIPLHHLQKVEAFLLQAMAPLRRINMWLPSTVSTYGSRSISWERRWLYDEDLCVPRRYVAVIPRHDDQWRNRA